LLVGKLLLVTNVTALSPRAIVQHYNSLANIEHGFRVLKSEIELAPVYHRLPQRIRTHAMICFTALILYRVMRQRLKMAQSTLLPERALAQLKRIHRHRIKVNDGALHGVSAVTKDQTDLLGTLTLKKTTKHEKLSLL
jgi:transposase